MVAGLQFSGGFADRRTGAPITDALLPPDGRGAVSKFVGRQQIYSRDGDGVHKHGDIVVVFANRLCNTVSIHCVPAQMVCVRHPQRK
ncbi:MAG: hypothetical protein NTV22_01040 [bacterium]|nr:hypothetical protein [bacterium]